MQITPQDLKIKTLSEDNNKGVFEFDPLPKGFGHTLGNSLRRVLLTSLEGAAITQVKVKGATHQFATVEGMKEDLVEFTLNLKKVRFEKNGSNPEVATLDVTGPGEVNAGLIETTSDVKILNPEAHLATLANKNSKLSVELVIESGVGYSPMEERQTPKVGVVVIDALFSPVINVVMSIEETRAGGRVDLDKVKLTVETDGSIKPSTAVYKSAQILSDFFGVLAKWEQDTETVAVSEETSTTETSVKSDDMSIDDLPLPTRTINALKKHGIETMSQLAQLTEEDLADVKNLGEKSVQEVNKLLKKEGLRG